MSISDRITKNGPKRILSCDGGGIRGLMTVEILAKMEADLRARYGDPNLVLSQFFDFVCGTSTGAIIATCVSAGMSTDAIRHFYLSCGNQIFDKATLFERVVRYSYDDEPLAKLLQRELDRVLEHESPPFATLGHEKLQTLLMMVMRNHTTDSPWPVWNNPRAKYNDRARADCNLDLPLWQLVRASSAAPTYFPPEVVTFCPNTPKEYSFVFVDGGVTTYNNPAFLAFQMATAAPYQVGWRTGVENLLLVSVGTGGAADVLPTITPAEMNKLHFALSIPSALMNAATAGWDMACRSLGECRFGPKIDREFGDMVVPPGTSSAGPKLFTYVRYDPQLTREGLEDLHIVDLEPTRVRALDAIEHLADLRRIGVAYALKHVDIAHLAPFTP